MCACCYGIPTCTHIKSLAYEIERDGEGLGASLASENVVEKEQDCAILD